MYDSKLYRDVKTDQVLCHTTEVARKLVKNDEARVVTLKTLIAHITEDAFDPRGGKSCTILVAESATVAALGY